MEASPTSPPPPPPPARPEKRIEIGRVLSEMFSLYGKNLAALLAVAVVIYVIAGVIQGFLRDEGGVVLVLIASVVGLIANALYTGFVVELVADVRADGRRDLTATELISSARHAIWPLIGAGILAGIGIAVGLILLIIPGLFLLTIWSVIAPAIVVERRGVIESFGRSHELVRGDAWNVFGVIVVVFLLVIAASIIAGAIGAEIGLAAVIILSILVAVLTAPIAALVASILFFDLGGGDRAPAATEPPAPPPAPAT
jgi:hypothetical protein